MSNLIVVGSINMDVVVTAPRHPQPGETIFGSTVHFIPGGKGSNQAVAANRLSKDGPVTLVGKLGKDAFGTALQSFLQHEGIILDHLSFSDTKSSGTALITVSESSENTIIVISGSNAELSTQDVAHVPMTSKQVMIATFETPQTTVQQAFAQANAVGATTVLNPAPAAAFMDGLANLCDVIILNETELAYFAHAENIPHNRESLITLAQTMRAKPDQTIVVTLGAEGVLCIAKDNTFFVEGRKVKAVDTTGAGDCFVGALSVALSEGQSLMQAVKFANTAASLSVQKLGASDSMPHRDQVEAVLNG